MNLVAVCHTMVSGLSSVLMPYSIVFVEAMVSSSTLVSVTAFTVGASGGKSRAVIFSTSPVGSLTSEPRHSEPLTSTRME
jgi:hypothetical protein